MPNAHPTSPQRLRLLLSSALCLLLGTSAASAIDPTNTRLLSSPDTNGSEVVFEYADDLWIAPLNGGSARRLTSHEGSETSPRFSPNGQHVAFTGEYDGNQDVYIVPAAGGAPTRLTFHPGSDTVQGFTPDGKEVLFASQRALFTNRYTQLFKIPGDPSDGRFPEQLPIPNGLRAAVSPDGSKIAYIPIPERMAQWKNYRGGTVARIWIYDVADHSVVEIPQPEGRSNDTDPVWIGERVVFRSDRGGEFDLWSYDASGADDPATAAGEEGLVRHTEFEQFPVLALGTDGSHLVYEQAGYLHSFDVAAGTSTQLRIGVADDLDDRRERWVSGAEWIRDADVAPEGERAVFEYRGDIVTLPAKKGDMRALTATPGVHERSPVWSPDGQSIAYFSDEGGEYELHIAPQRRQAGEEIEITRYGLQSQGGAGFYEAPQWSPDGKKIALMDNSWALFVLDVETGNLSEVAREPLFGPPPVRALEYAWSPDSRWLAYTLNTKAMIASAWVYDTQDGNSTRITDGLSDVAEPAFDRSGKYLYFLASTDAGPVKHWFAMSNADMERSFAVYVAVLQADEDSPLAAESDEVPLKEEDKDDGEEGDGEDGETKAEGSDAGDKKDGDEKDGPPPVEIDFEGIDQRILALPMSEGNYSSVTAGDGKVWAVRQGSNPFAPGDLVQYDLKAREESTLASGIAGYALSASAKKILWTTDGRTWGIADAGKIDPSKGLLPVDRLRTKVDPPAEWAQIFREVWRMNRDYFYDPGMHGADWDAMGEVYGELLPHLATRGDLNRVIRWLLSELAVGHSYLGGGDDRDDADSIPGGLLGADWEVADGRYRLAKVFGGLNWNPDLRAPLSVPGVSAEAGEYLIAVNGREVTASDNLYEHFEGTAGRTVDITLSQSADGADARTVRVEPIRNESALRNRDWVERNLRYVHEKTDGRVAYVYVPNTTGAGHEYFKRYFFPQVDKEAIIVDERFNGGGQTADYVIDHLRRPDIARWATRYGDTVRTPSASIQGPKVMLIDETAGSGGDLLPWMFRKLELGPLIGKRTWGGLVGILGFPVLLDGGFVTAPNLAIWTEDGFVVENVGVPADIEVEQWPVDVIAGKDPQLDRAIEEVLRMLEDEAPAEWQKPEFPVRARQRE